MPKTLNAYFFIARDPGLELGGSAVEVIVSQSFDNAVKVINMKYNTMLKPNGYVIDSAGSVPVEEIKSYISHMEEQAGLKSVFNFESTPKHAIPKDLERMVKKAAKETVKEQKAKFVYGLKLVADKVQKTMTPAQRKVIKEVITKFEKKVSLNR